MSKLVIGGIALGTAALIGGIIAAVKSSSHDENGYDKNGYDKDGYDKDGYDKDGYDKFGYNKDGYNMIGYDEDGYNKDGYNENGYDKFGYDEFGLDCSNRNRADYSNEIQGCLEQLKKGKAQMKEHAYTYATIEIRKGMEKGISCIVSHKDSESYCNTLHEYITYCRDHQLLDSEFCKKLYQAKNICNSEAHDNEEEITYNQLYFAYKVYEELIEKIKKICDL
jgi:hypothetical protein